MKSRKYFWLVVLGPSNTFFSAIIFLDFHFLWCLEELPGHFEVADRASAICYGAIIRYIFFFVCNKP